MPKRIDISGVILPDDYYFFANCFGDIDIGVVTTPCVVAWGLGAAKDGVEIHINSYGGDVFAANTIENLIANWSRENPDQDLTFVVEAYAMSAAANLLATAPDKAKIIMHENSLVMYHSCTTYTWGGPGAHKDAAAVMDKINSHVMGKLKKCGIDENVVAEWFAEGRQGWLTADDAKECNLCDEIYKSESEPAPKQLQKEEDQKLAAFYTGQTGRLAAYLNHKKETAMPRPKQEDDPKKKRNPLTQEGTEPEKEKEEETNQEGAEPEKEKEEETNQEGAEPEKEKEEEEEEVKQLKQQVELLQRQLKEANDTIAKLTPGMRQQQKQSLPAQDWQSMVASIPPGLPQQEWDRRYIKLRQENPEAYKKYITQKR